MKFSLLLTCVAGAALASPHSVANSLYDRDIHHELSPRDLAVHKRAIEIYESKLALHSLSNPRSDNPLRSDGSTEVASVENTISQVPLGDIVCGSDNLSPTAIMAAITAGHGIASMQDFKNGRTYPHRFNNREGLPFPGCTGQLFEHPILITGDVHPGGKAGRKVRPEAHRVVFEATGSGKYCGIITHEGSKVRNGFISCRSDKSI